MNSLFQQLQPTQPQSQPVPVQQLRQQPQQQKLLLSKNNLISNFLKSSNPEQFIQRMIGTNPNLRNVMQLFQNSKLTPKQFFYQYAQQQGINPDQFLDSFVE